MYTPSESNISYRENSEPPVQYVSLACDEMSSYTGIKETTAFVRPLLALKDLTIHARSSAHVETNAIILKPVLDAPTVSSLYMSVKSMQNNWLFKDISTTLTCREGVINPSYDGRLSVQIFNRSFQPLLIEACSPIAELHTATHEYNMQKTSILH